MENANKILSSYLKEMKKEKPVYNCQIVFSDIGLRIYTDRKYREDLKKRRFGFLDPDVILDNLKPGDKVPDRSDLSDQGIMPELNPSLYVEKNSHEYWNAKAEIEKDKLKWTVTGILIVWKSKDNSLIACDAVLLNSEGMTVAKGSKITIPIDNPSAFEVIKN